MITFQGLTPNALVDVASAQAPTIAVKPGAWTPVADAYELDDQCVIEIELPGCQSSNITVKVVNDEISVVGKAFYVVVEGRREIVPNATWRFHNERWQGDFGRIFRVPDSYDPATAGSSYIDGLLRIYIPKKPSKSPSEKNIHVESASSHSANTRMRREKS